MVVEPPRSVPARQPVLGMPWIESKGPAIRHPGRAGYVRRWTDGSKVGPGGCTERLAASVHAVLATVR